MVHDRERPGQSCTTVYYDGSCALCRAEISLYDRQDAQGALELVDISDASAVPEGVDSEAMMKRFHVQRSDGTVVSGAEAIVEIWRALPGWRWAARLASLPGAMTLLELGYRAFLPLRPYLSRLVGRMTRRPPA